MFPVNKRIALPLPKTPGTSHPPAFNKRYFYWGLALLIAFAVQEVYGWRWLWLAELQADVIYRQLSGFVLVAFLAHQWHCSVLRDKGLMREAGRILTRHKLIGSSAPLVFYAHSQTLGFAYLQVLSLVYLAVFLTGLFNFETTRIREPWFQPLWITVHVGLSTALLFLLGYHIYISYAYR